MPSGFQWSGEPGYLRAEGIRSAAGRWPFTPAATRSRWWTSADRATAGDVATLTIDSNSYNYYHSGHRHAADRSRRLIASDQRQSEREGDGGAGRRVYSHYPYSESGRAGWETASRSPVSASANATITMLSRSAARRHAARTSLVHWLPRSNPVVPGEVITIYATGIGATTLADRLTPASCHRARSIRGRR